MTAEFVRERIRPIVSNLAVLLQRGQSGWRWLSRRTPILEKNDVRERLQPSGPSYVDNL